MDQPALSGACKCGSVTFRADADLRRIINCHCNMCRQMNGSAFSTYAVIPRKLLVISGDENLGDYKVTVAARRYFCKKCGTPLFNTNEIFPGACMIYLGTIERSAGHLPSVNIFSESMLGWVETIGALAKFQQHVQKAP